jgi:hypothetical protein
MSIMRLAFTFYLATLALPVGCGGPQYSSPSESGWSDDLGDPSVQPLEGSENPERRSDAPTPMTAAPTTQLTEMRVRHDLMMAKDAPHEANCSCLSILVAQAPTDTRLMWIDAPPKLEADVAVVAMSDKGITCPGLPADATERPSISGVERDGANVVIVVENLPPGRPIASGAVIPKPGPGGSVYVKPKGPKVLYGRPLPGAATTAGRCKVR